MACSRRSVGARQICISTSTDPVLVIRSMRTPRALRQARRKGHEYMRARREQAEKALTGVVIVHHTEIHHRRYAAALARPVLDRAVMGRQNSQEPDEIALDVGERLRALHLPRIRPPVSTLVLAGARHSRGALYLSLARRRRPLDDLAIRNPRDEYVDEAQGRCTYATACDGVGARQLSWNASRKQGKRE